MANPVDPTIAALFASFKMIVEASVSETDVEALAERLDMDAITDPVAVDTLPEFFARFVFESSWKEDEELSRVLQAD